MRLVQSPEIVAGRAFRNSDKRVAQPPLRPCSGQGLVGCRPSSIQRRYLLIQNFHGLFCQGVFVPEEAGGVTERNFGDRFAGKFP